MPKQVNYYSLGIITIFFSRDVIPTRSTKDRSLPTNDCQKIVSDEFNVIITDIQHRHNADDILFRTSEHPWTIDHLPMHLILRQDRANIEQAEVIKLSKISKNSSALVRCDLTLVETMEELVKHAAVLDLRYRFKLVEDHIKVIVDNTLSSEKIPTRTRAAYVWYIRTARRAVFEKQCFAVRNVHNRRWNREESGHNASPFLVSV